MRFEQLVLGLAILASSLPASAALNGGESSAGGADDYRIVPAYFRASWRNEPVTACIQSKAGFGVDDDSLADIVRRAFRQWGEYIGQKRLDISSSRLRIRNEIDLRKSCAGDEELTFYFGVENEMIAKYRGQFSNPIGFAQLVHSGSCHTGEYACSCSVQPDGSCSAPEPKAQAFIWIAPSGGVDPARQIPSWSYATRDALAGLVLHEVGHVFGNGHVDGTVMTPKIKYYLENDTAPSQSASRNVSLYSKIDSQLELVPCMECRMAYTAAETFDQLPPIGQDSDWILTFRMLMGHDPVPPLAIRYERLGSPQGSGRLTLMDSTGVYPFDVNVESWIIERRDTTPLFTLQEGTSFYSYGISYYARLHPKQGGQIQVAVSYNMMDETPRGHKAMIIPLGGQGFYPRPIFVSAD